MKRLFSVSAGDDILAAVVRWHLHIEYQLVQFVQACLPAPDELGSRTTYSGLVRLALACGLRKDLKAPLNALGSLRNRFAHDIKTQLTEGEIAAFRDAFRNFKYDPPCIADYYDATEIPRERLLDYVVNISKTLEAETQGRLQERAQISN
jgi:hypothetical protein